MLAWSVLSWVLSARKWFTGPIRHVKAELTGIDESQIKDGEDLNTADIQRGEKDEIATTEKV